MEIHLNTLYVMTPGSYLRRDRQNITVEVNGSKAILRGTVRSYAERRDAERAARNAPGITDVENKLTVDPSIYAAV